jgi:hypothetical protein
MKQRADSCLMMQLLMGDSWLLQLLMGDSWLLQLLLRTDSWLVMQMMLHGVGRRWLDNQLVLYRMEVLWWWWLGR